MKYIDMHVHSTYSDGAESVENLIKKAKENNVDFLSITDHDIIIPSNEILSESNIVIVKGIELSTKYNFLNQNIYIHLLGYDYDSNNKELNEELSRMKEVLKRGHIETLDKISCKKIDVPSYIKEQVDLNNYMLIDEQIRRLLIKNNYSFSRAQDIAKEIQKYNSEYPSYEIDIKKAIKLIIDSGGIAIIAHPNKIKISKQNIFKLIASLKKIGLVGIESCHSSFTKDDFIFYKEIAKKLNLLESVGSDFHCEEENQGIVIGHGIDNNICSESCSAKELIMRRKNNG